MGMHPYHAHTQACRLHTYAGRTLPGSAHMSAQPLPKTCRGGTLTLGHGAGQDCKLSWAAQKWGLYFSSPFSSTHSGRALGIRGVHQVPTHRALVGQRSLPALQGQRHKNFHPDFQSGAGAGVCGPQGHHWGGVDTFRCYVPRDSQDQSGWGAEQGSPVQGWLRRRAPGALQTVS